jgi:hypothetical protein
MPFDQSSVETVLSKSEILLAAPPIRFTDQEVPTKTLRPPGFDDYSERVHETLGRLLDRNRGNGWKLSIKSS